MVGYGFYPEDNWTDEPEWCTVRYRRGRLVSRDYGVPPARYWPSHDHYEPGSYHASNEPLHSVANQPSLHANYQANYHPQPTSRPANGAHYSYTYDNQASYQAQPPSVSYSRPSYADATRPVSFNPPLQTYDNGGTSDHGPGQNNAAHPATSGGGGQQTNNNNHRQTSNNSRGKQGQSASRSRSRSKQGRSQQQKQGNNRKNNNWVNNKNNKNAQKNPQNNRNNNNYGRKNQKQNNNAQNRQQQPRQAAQRSSDPDFSVKNRTIHRLIKAEHHLRNVSAQDAPKAITKITKMLSDVIKPSDPIDPTKKLIADNAAVWEQNTIEILRGHYNRTLAGNLQFLLRFDMSSWQQNFDIAASWARSHFGRRLLPDTVDVVYAKIIEALQNQIQANTRPTTQPRGSSIPAAQDRVIEVLMEAEDTTTQPRTILQQNWYDAMTAGQEAPPSMAAPRPQRLPRTRPPDPGPASTAGQLLVTADVHQDPTDRAQPTETTGPEIRAETGGPLSPHPPPPLSSPAPPNPPPLSPSSSLSLSPPPLTSSPFLAPPLPLEALNLSNEIPPTPPPGLPPTSRPAPIFDPETEFPELSKLREQFGSRLQDLRSPATSAGRPAAPAGNPPSLTPLRLLPSDGGARVGETPHTSSGAVTTRGKSPSDNLGPLNQAKTQSKLSFATPVIQTVFSPHRHPNVTDKMNDWSLTAHKPWLLVGDSNLSRLPPYSQNQVQIESYPGAAFKHAEAILASAPVSTAVKVLVLSFGINNRGQDPDKVSIPHIKKVIRMAKLAFPQARILIPILNFSRSLSHQEQQNLRGINEFLVCYEDHIPQLSRSVFSTDKDHVHWTMSTAKHMFDHWMVFLNTLTP